MNNVFLCFFVPVESFLLLKSVVVKNIKVLDNWDMLVFTEVKDASLFLVYASHHPLIISDIVVDFFASIPDS